jgi:hypothetical protein
VPAGPLPAGSPVPAGSTVPAQYQTMSNDALANFKEQQRMETKMQGEMAMIRFLTDLTSGLWEAIKASAKRLSDMMKPS